MFKKFSSYRSVKKATLSLLCTMLSVSVTHSVNAAPAQDPLFLTAPVTPLMMLNMSRDHQLYFKIYDDYADITRPDGGEPDGKPDITYNNNYDYYGYFDSKKCYQYSTTNNRFEPKAWRDANRACLGTHHWSGNFLNWSTMTRMDAIRKILYGGYRSTDNVAGANTHSVTVLERALLPNDIHSFAKFYKASSVAELKKVVPDALADSSGITLCNTTDPSTRTKPSSGTSAALSQNVTQPPLIKVAKGNYSLWANNERWQCGWRNDSNNGVATAVNGNNAAVSGINAASGNPSKGTDGTGYGNYVARVQVCVPGFIDDVPEEDNENCRTYSPRNIKPIGLLQEFGENNSIHFGLITGSYSKNKSGGVLRKAIGSITNEVDLTTAGTGTGKFLDPTNGIINTLNKLRIFGYNYGEGLYNVAPSGAWNATPPDHSWSDNCSWFGGSSTYKRAYFEDGRCTNWGNPQAEIYLESLRYLAGTSAATAEFNANDSSRISGLNTAAWSDPISETASGNYCAPLNILQFNASTISYDADQLSGASDVGITNLTTETNLVAAAEEILNRDYFVGRVSEDSNALGFELCTAKNVTDLSSVRGVCPEAPRLEGSYQIAGLAYHARRVGLPAKNSQYGREKVTTYGVALAPATPSVTVNLANNKSFTIMPACRNLDTYSARSNSAVRHSNCAIVDFKIVEYNENGSGKLYVSWEDMEQGGDLDQDMWGIIEYSVSGDTLTVTTDAIAESTGDRMAFGYVISGTTDDGFKAHSGIHGFTWPGTGCNNCQVGNAATSKTYTLGTSAGTLKDPLYYAAKWGGYPESLVRTTLPENLPAAIASSTPQTYFYATDPRKLESSMRAAFKGVAGSIGSASAVSTSSTRLTTDSLVYQALFSSEDWSGELKILKLGVNDELVPSNPLVTTDAHSTFLAPNARKIYTFNTEDETTVEFNWLSLAAEQQAALRAGGASEAVGQDRLNWIRGDRTKENATGGMRIREKLLGDIVNSSPVYSGNKNPRYAQLPGAMGTSYATFSKARIVYVGANDGMLHGFDADTLAEVFAYVPKGVYPKLANLTQPDYGMGTNRHQYFVDGAITVGDAYINGAWKTILVGALGAGGRGIFALDVTDTANPRVIFDMDSSDNSALGYVMGEPAIVPMRNGKWAAIFENGYESGSTSQLFIVDLEAPGTPIIIDTAGGTGLSAVALLPNSAGQIEYAYGGDLAGNVWKFDLSSANSAAWGLAYKLFTARDANGNTQPISGAPTLGLNPLKNNAVMVYLGTGKYFEAGDNNTPAAPRHSFYALADTGSTIEYNQATRNTILHQKAISNESTATRRVITGERNANGTSDVDWASKRGWFIDFSTANGERVITKPLLVFDRLIFTTLIPSTLQCDYGGNGWLMELVAVGNRNITHSILGDLANSSLDNAVLGDLSVTTGPGPDRVNIIPCDIKGDCDLIEGVAPAGARGRMSWRQVR